MSNQLDSAPNPGIFVDPMQVPENKMAGTNPAILHSITVIGVPACTVEVF
jgi:hypothetical protein